MKTKTFFINKILPITLLLLSIFSCSKITNSHIDVKIKDNKTFSNNNITTINSSPVSYDLSLPNLNEDTQSIITLSYTDSELDAGSSCSITNLTNAIVTSPCICLLGICSVGITGTPNYFGLASFDYSVSAAGSSSNIARANFTIDPINDPPTISTPTSQITNEDTPIVVNFTISDVESILTCAGSVSGASSDISKVATAGIVIAGTYPNCNATITPLFDKFGTANITLDVSDSSLNTNSSFSLSITSVEDAPVAYNINPVSFNEDVQSIITLSYTDAELDLPTACTLSNLTDAVETSPCTCTLGVCTVGVTGAANHYGVAGFDYTVTAGVNSNTAHATLTINPINDPPIISAITAKTTVQDTPIAVIFTIADIDTTLTCAANVSGTSSVLSRVVNAGIVITGTYPNCTATITPVAAAYGITNITLSVNDGTANTTSAFTLTITSINPIVTFDAIQAQGLNVNETNHGDFVLTGTCSIVGRDVGFNYDWGRTTPCLSDNTFNFHFDFSQYNDGPITITADFDDGLGNNATQASVSLTKLTPPVAYISGLDDGVLRVLVSGLDIVSYRYKIGLTGVTDCTDVTGYSAEIASTVRVTDDYSSVPNGTYQFCAIGKKATGVWQNLAVASSATWLKQGPSVAIYRSIGPTNTSALATGSGNNFTISGTTATFASALPNNVGVGDIIQYASSGAGPIDSIAFIHARISSTQYTVANSIGDSPVGTSNHQNWSIFRAYSNIDDLGYGLENSGIDSNVRDFDSDYRDLGVLNNHLYIALYNDAEAVGDFWLGRIVTTQKNFVTMFTPYLPSQVGVSQRHNGTMATGFRIRGGLGISSSYSTVEGLIIYKDSNNDDSNIVEMVPWTWRGAIASIYGDTGVGDTKMYFQKNIIRSSGTNSNRTMVSAYTFGGNGLFYNLNQFYISNNIIIDKTTATNSAGIEIGIREYGPDLFDEAYIYNNTIHTDNNRAILVNSGTFKTLNNIFSGTNSWLVDWGGYGNRLTPANVNGNINVNDTGSSTNYARNNVPVTFVNPGNDDFRLSNTDTGAQGYGLDLSADSNLPFNTDITGATRSTWDSGASVVFP